MLLTAAELINYVYPEGEDPAEAFEWWLSPCGGSDIVPDELKQVFDILSLIPTGRSIYRTPKNIKKGSGKKGATGTQPIALLLDLSAVINLLAVGNRIQLERAIRQRQCGLRIIQAQAGKMKTFGIPKTAIWTNGPLLI